MAYVQNVDAHYINNLSCVVQDQWYRRAQLALDKGEEELARDALRRKKSFSDNALLLKKQLDQHTKATSQLRGNIRYIWLLAALLVIP